MAIPEHLKRRSMDAVSHKETQAHMRLLRGPTAVTAPAPGVPASRGVIPQEVKRLAMNAIAHVETVAQAGVIRVAGGIAVYAAHIRQVDMEAKREAQRDIGPRSFSAARHTYGRE
jgi:hypothetical protein